MKYRIGRRLVGDRTAKARLQTVTVTESQFADDVAVYATTREALNQATASFVRVAADWGLTVSLVKSKVLVAGNHLEPTDTMPIQLDGGLIDVVDNFTYLGSNITEVCELQNEVAVRIGKASRAFGCLQKSIFQNKRLSTSINREVYRATVLSVLLYGTETWAVKAHSLRRLSGFHNRCIRSIMGVSKVQQWKERITSTELAEEFGMTETMKDILMRHRLRWLGHIARMDDHRLPKQLLFGELQRKRPRPGTKRRWRNLMAADVQSTGLGEEWYAVAQDRKKWTKRCEQGGSDEDSESRAANNSIDPNNMFPCSCGRIFRRRGDLTRHSRFCDGTQHSQRPTMSSFECLCGRILRRKGDLTRHTRFCIAAS